MAANGSAMWGLMQAAVVPIGQRSGEIPPLTVLESKSDLPLEEFQLLNLVDAAPKGVNYLAAPVFSPDGEICFEIVMSGFPVDLDSAEFELYAARLVMGAETVTKEIRGRKPSVW